jgi:DNA repair protein RadC
MKKWHHPGGKLREQGAHALTDTELLAVLISTGIRGKPAEKIAEEIVEKYGSFYGMANQPLEKFLEFRGVSDRKIIRIAAAFEIGRRLAKGSIGHGQEK